MKLRWLNQPVFSIGPALHASRECLFSSPLYSYISTVPRREGHFGDIYWMSMFREGLMWVFIPGTKWPCWSVVSGDLPEPRCDGRRIREWDPASWGRTRSAGWGSGLLLCGSRACTQWWNQNRVSEEGRCRRTLCGTKAKNAQSTCAFLGHCSL